MPGQRSAAGSKPCRREDLMSAVKNRDLDQLVDITKSTKVSELSDAVAELSKANLSDLWENVYGLCTSALMSGGDGEEEDEEFSTKMNLVLKSVTDLAQATVTALLAQRYDDDCQTTLAVPQSLQESVILLHGMLPNLSTDGQAALKNQMCRLCEDWWTNNLAGKGDTALNAFLYLLDRTTQPKTFQADVSRVWAMRGVLVECVDLTDHDSKTLVSLLQLCMHHPTYISTNHGVRFLAYILALTPDLTNKLHQCIKNVLFTTPRSWHGKYGEIYFRSWQSASEDMRKTIEESCIQDLMFRAIHASRRGPYCPSATLYRVMSYLHKQKTQKGVEVMLVRLYGPILWRALKVPNSDVRLNAALLMFNVIPLQDPNHLREEADAALQRQFDLMNSLLSDPVAEIRVEAVLGIGRVLSAYWELIPVQVIQGLLATLVQDMAYDSAAPSVREAVIKVMFLLCDNHLCIPTLKKVLPDLGNFIHDNSEKVRVAMLDLLLKVRGLRAIKYWSIVPIEHVLARLEVDADSRFVSRHIMSLIWASFVPLNLPPSQQVERCLALIASNRGAARQFYLNLSKSLGVVDTAKYILVLCRFALESTRLWSSSSQDSVVVVGGGSGGGGSTSGHLQSGDRNEEDSSQDESVVIGGGQRTNKNTRTKSNNNNNNNNSNTEGGGKRRRRSSRSVGRRRNEEDGGGDDERNVAESSQGGSGGGGGENVFDMDALSGLVEAVYLMFTSIVSELGSGSGTAATTTEHSGMKDGLMKKLSVTVRELIKVSDDPLLEDALVGLAGHLPSRTLPLVSQNLFNKLKQRCRSSSSRSISSPPEGVVLEVVGGGGGRGGGSSGIEASMVKALVQWGRAGHLLELVDDSIMAFLKTDASPMAVGVGGESLPWSSKGAKQRSGSPKGRKKVVAFNVNAEEESMATIGVEKALQILDHMLSHAELRPILLVDKHKSQMAALVVSLERLVFTKMQDILKCLAANSSSSSSNGNKDIGEEESASIGRRKTGSKASDLKKTVDSNSNSNKPETALAMSVFSACARLATFLCLKADDEDLADKTNNKATKKDVRVDVDDNDNDNDDKGKKNTGRDEDGKVGYCYLQSCLSWILRVVLPQLESLSSSSDDDDETAATGGLSRLQQQEQQQNHSLGLICQLIGTALKACGGLAMVGLNHGLVTDLAGEICMGVLNSNLKVLKAGGGGGLAMRHLVQDVLVFTYQLTQLRRQGGEEGGGLEGEEGKENEEPMEMEEGSGGGGRDKQEAETKGAGAGMQAYAPSKHPLQFALLVLESAFNVITSMNEHQQQQQQQPDEEEEEEEREGERSSSGRRRVGGSRGNSKNRQGGGKKGNTKTKETTTTTAAGASTTTTNTTSTINSCTTAMRTTTNNVPTLSSLNSSACAILSTLVKPGACTQMCCRRAVGVATSLLLRDVEKMMMSHRCSQEGIGSVVTIATTTTTTTTRTDEGDGQDDDTTSNIGGGGGGGGRCLLAGLDQNVLACLKKQPRTLGWLTETLIAHLESDHVTVHALQGVLYLADAIKTKGSQAVDPDLQDAIRDCWKTVSPHDGMDEDVFRDVKNQVEQKMKDWNETRSSGRTSTTTTTTTMTQ